ncbi:lipopolysaccharide-induced tumor necrosis factor-alpha factor-like protein [Trichonephila clavipes]|nr:lipopolysaccharide-induced tumor necrosis factor-alpha factor-like protein [Trichonephila clavipes]
MQKSYPDPHTPTPNVTVVAPPQMYGLLPMQVTCGNCKNVVVTVTTCENGGCVYLAAIVIVFCFFPLVFIPFLTDSCKDVTHYCPACNARLGTYKRL